jgi:hypothetical protein
MVYLHVLFNNFKYSLKHMAPPHNETLIPRNPASKWTVSIYVLKRVQHRTNIFLKREFFMFVLGGHSQNNMHCAMCCIGKNQLKINIATMVRRRCACYITRECENTSTTWKVVTLGGGGGGHDQRYFPAVQNHIPYIRWRGQHLFFSV